MRKKKKSWALSLFFFFPDTQFKVSVAFKAANTLKSATGAVQRGNLKAPLYKSKAAVTLYGNNHRSSTAQSLNSVFMYFYSSEAIAELGCLRGERVARLWRCGALLQRSFTSDEIRSERSAPSGVGDVNASAMSHPGVMILSFTTTSTREKGENYTFNV